MAASKMTEMATRFESILQCAICLDLYKEPRMLVCGHVFCEICLRRLVGQARAARCPTCQQVCQVGHMIKAFVLNDIVEVQKTITIETPRQHQCESCEHTTEIDDLWACESCDLKMTCSKCMIRNGHGTKCDKDPRNLSEAALDKQRVLAEWHRSTCAPGFNALNRGIDRFSSQLSGMRRRVINIRDLLKDEVLNEHGDGAALEFRREITSIQIMAEPLVRMSACDPCLWDNHNMDIDDKMEEVATRLKECEQKIDWHVQKFQRCFEVLDTMVESMRQIIEEEPPSTDNQPDVIAHAESTPNQVEIVSDPQAPPKVAPTPRGTPRVVPLRCVSPSDAPRSEVNIQYLSQDGQAITSVDDQSQ